MKYRAVVLALAMGMVCTKGVTQERVTIILKHSRPSFDNQTQMKGNCKEGAYLLELSREPAALKLRLNDTKIVDLSTSPLGNAILTQPIAGDFYFKCMHDILEIYFFGFLIQKSKPPKPVAHDMSINFAGQTISEDRLQPAEPDYVNEFFLSRANTAAAQHR